MLTFDECRARVQQRLGEGGLVILDDAISRFPWGWVFPVASREYARTRQPSDVLIGAPHAFLIEQRSGRIEPALSYQPLEHAIRSFERSIGHRPWWKVW